MEDLGTETLPVSSTERQRARSSFMTLGTMPRNSLRIASTVPAQVLGGYWARSCSSACGIECQELLCVRQERRSSAYLDALKELLAQTLEEDQGLAVAAELVEQRDGCRSGADSVGGLLEVVLGQDLQADGVQHLVQAVARGGDAWRAGAAGGRRKGVSVANTQLWLVLCGARTARRNPSECSSWP